MIKVRENLKDKLKIILPKFVINLIHWYRCKKMPLLKNVLDSNYLRNALLVYITEPFITGINDKHQNSWQTVEIARQLNEFGYNVDVIDWEYNKRFLEKKYDLLIDLHPRKNACYLKSLKNNAIKIAYLTGSNSAFSNNAEIERIKNLYKRKNIRIFPRRQEILISKIIESYNSVFFIGNKYNLKTYSYFKMPPIYFIKNTGYNFNFCNTKRKANNFMFLGSFGQVHKGLDLLLEVFSETCKDCNLYVCSNFEKETDFCEAYEKELYNTPNIYPIGFVDIKSNKFKEIAEKCAYMIMPSCSEANAGSVLTAMSAGMVPIVSRECGFEDGEVIYLKDCSKECIKEAIKFYANKNSEWIRYESDKAVKIIKERYSAGNFSESLKHALNETIELHDKLNNKE